MSHEIDRLILLLLVLSLIAELNMPVLILASNLALHLLVALSVPIVAENDEFYCFEGFVRRSPERTNRKARVESSISDRSIIKLILTNKFRSCRFQVTHQTS